MPTPTPVSYSPVISMEPSPQTALVGGSAAFKVTADGYPGLIYQWYDNGTALAGATGSTLTIPGVTAGSAGLYSVRVTNPLGSVTSSLELLTVAAVPTAPTFTVQPKAAEGPVGSTVTFTAAAQGAPAPSYQWYANGVPVAGATASSLRVASVGPGNAGTYQVQATNTAGLVLSTPVALTIAGAQYTGNYVGKLAGGGTFDLLVRSDDTGVFLGYAPGASVPYLDLNVAISPTGAFSFVASVPGGGPLHTQLTPRVDSSGTTITGTLANGTLTGTIGGVAFTATPSPVGATSGVAGFYEAAVPGNSTVVYLIVGPSGQAFALLEGPAGADGGAGMVSSSGQVAVTTAGGGTLTATISAGDDTVEGSEAGGTIPAASFTGAASGSTAAASQRIINISSRAQVSGGSQVAIAGFVIGGQSSKTVLLRAVGPSLGTFGVTGTLTAPTLTLYSGSTVVATNTGWGTALDPDELAAAATESGAFALTAGSADSVILTTLAPGAYTAVVSSATGGTGVALAEVYDLSGAQTGQEVVNLSTRAFAGTGANSLIAGVVVGGSTPKRLLIRAAGPALTQFGVVGVLVSPQLTLYSGATAVATNTGWSSSPDAAAISAATASVGAFAYAAGSTDSALIVNVPPGPYTAEVTGVGGTTGVALVEIYEVP